MLQSLYIENFAIIEQISVDFEQGLNIFTGETGAGKSIVIGAINAVLGNRTSKEMVRTGAEKAKIIASFNNISNSTKQKLELYDIHIKGDEIIIYREISNDGKSVSKINSIPITLNNLRDITSELINVHGQHDTQILLKTEKHIEILDSFCNFGQLLENYKQLYYKIIQNKKTIKELSSDDEYKKHRIDLLSFQINEIANADIKVGEDEDLEQKRVLAINSKKYIQSLQRAKNLLSGEENLGVCDLFASSINELQTISALDNEVLDIYNKSIEIQAETENIISVIDKKLNAVDFSLNDLEQIEDRLNEINTIKKKFGLSIEQFYEYCEKAKSELENLNFSEQKIIMLSDENNVLKQQIFEIAEKINEIRQKAALELENKIKIELEFLQMPNVLIKIDIKKGKYTSIGNDNVEMLISTNLGEPPKSISKIASGGELSRIMLALKNVFSEKDEINSLIFDEIDTGVSGKTAQKIGLKLKQVAKLKQVICITHLAQIAALADTNYLISKQTVNERTFTVIKRLDYKEKVEEVARIIGTGTITQATIQMAEEMIIN